MNVLWMYRGTADGSGPYTLAEFNSGTPTQIDGWGPVVQNGSMLWTSGHRTMWRTGWRRRNGLLGYRTAGLAVADQATSQGTRRGPRTSTLEVL